MTAAEHYAARVDAVMAQRARLRGAEPSGDLYGKLEPDHPLLKADPRRPLDANLKALADLIEPSDAIVDVGGGAGRMSLPLALRCRSVTNVDPSASMGAAFLANAKAAGISNVALVQSDWLAADAPQGTIALANHVTYLTRDIVPFIEKLERAGSRRVIVTVNAPPPPSWNRVLFQLVHGEAEEVMPGHAELMNVLWEMGRLPDLTMLSPQNVRLIVPLPSRAAALDFAVQRVANEQWAHWPVAVKLLEMLLHRSAGACLERGAGSTWAARSSSPGSRANSLPPSNPLKGWPLDLRRSPVGAVGGGYFMARE